MTDQDVIRHLVTIMPTRGRARTAFKAVILWVTLRGSRNPDAAFLGRSKAQKARHLWDSRVFAKAKASLRCHECSAEMLKNRKTMEYVHPRESTCKRRWECAPIPGSKRAIHL